MAGKHPLLGGGTAATHIHHCLLPFPDVQTVFGDCVHEDVRLLCVCVCVGGGGG